MENYPFSLLFIWGTKEEKEAFKKERGYGKYAKPIFD